MDMHLLHDTLHDVQLIAADDDLLALVESTKSFELWLDSGTQAIVAHVSRCLTDAEKICIYLRVFRNTVRIDAHGAVTDGSNVSLDIDTTACGSLVSTYADARGGEVTRVGVCLEADEVGTEHAVEDLLPARETSEYFGTREGRVDE